jgi:hypothetical protein
MNTSPKLFAVAGVKFRPPEDIATAIRKLDSRPAPHTVTLTGEPSNKYDCYAVKVSVCGIFIGYVPKPTNIDIWALKGKGYKPTAVLESYNANAQTHNMFFIKVTFELTNRGPEQVKLSQPSSNVPLQPCRPHR